MGGAPFVLKYTTGRTERWSRCSPLATPDLPGGEASWASKHLGQQGLLQLVHFLSCGRRGIVVTGQMEEAMDQIERNFTLERGSKLLSLTGGRFYADQDITFLSIGESDHIRGVRVVHELCMHPLNLRIIDQRDTY